MDPQDSSLLFQRSCSYTTTLVGSSQDARQQYSTGIVAIFVWLLVGVFNSASAEIGPQVTGISISINAADAIGMLLTNLLLIRGLEHSNHYFVIPWIITSSWSMYNCHYKSVKKMVHVLKVTRMHNALPWVAIAVDCLALGLRLLLTFRVMQLMINQWYEKRLKSELEQAI